MTDDAITPSPLPRLCERHGRPVRLIEEYMTSSRDGFMHPTGEYHCAVCADPTRGPDWTFR